MSDKLLLLENTIIEKIIITINNKDYLELIKKELCNGMNIETLVLGLDRYIIIDKYTVEIDYKRDTQKLELIDNQITIINDINTISIDKYDIVSYIMFYIIDQENHRKKKIKILSHDIYDNANITVKMELDQHIRRGKHFGM